MTKKRFKILLVNPPSVCLIPSGFKGYSFYDYLKSSEPDHDHLPGEHLGIQYIAAYLDSKRKDTETFLLNACVERHTNIQQTYDSIVSYGELDVIGFTGPFNVFEEVLWLAKQIKAHCPNTKIVYGQYFASLNYAQILEKYPVFDYICVGDGEVPFERFIAYLNDEISIDRIPSFAYIKNGKCVLNQIIYDYTDLKTLIPRREYAEKVLDAGMNLSITASRGCPYRCSFCVSGSLMSKGKSHANYLLRDPVAFVDELEQLKKRYGIKRVVFVDDTFAAGTLQAKEQTRQIATEIIRRDLQLSIMIDTRIDCIDECLFKLLKQAGLSKAFVGIESNNSSALNIYNKGYNQQDVKQRLAILQKLDIKIIPGIINFNPKSTVQELKHNVDFILDLNKDYSIKLSNSFIPYPGTVLTNQFIQSGNVIGDFPYYTVKYDCNRVELLQKYFVLFNKIYTKTRNLCTTPSIIKHMEYVSEYFFNKMLEIAEKSDSNDKYKQCFDAIVEEINLINRMMPTRLCF